MAATFTPIAPRPAPVRTTGISAWVRRNLFGDVKSTVTTVIIALVAIVYVPQILNWAFLHAVFNANLAACNEARGTGACWGVIAARSSRISGPSTSAGCSARPSPVCWRASSAR